MVAVSWAKKGRQDKVSTILVADDDAHVGRVLSMWLTRHGHEVLIVRNGVEALDVIAAREVNLVISDMNMPELDWLVLAKALREAGHVDLPFMMLTARCDQDTLTKQMSKYRINVFPKPFFPSKLVAEINRLMGAAAT